MCNLKSFGCEHVDVGSRFSKIEIYVTAVDDVTQCFSTTALSRLSTNAIRVLVSSLRDSW